MTVSTDKASYFIEHEKQFHLGVLPTEQFNPKTKDLSDTIKKDTVAGIRLLQSVDRDVHAMAKKVFTSAEFEKLATDLEETIRNGGRIIFSGCGATGRLSIQLEACWRKFCQKANRNELKDRENQVFSIMTGGDYALVRSVESFEDYMEFGRQQARELNICEKDTLVAITEGGETSSVIGTCWEAVDRGANVFLMFNNPTEILRSKVERSRDIIDCPAVTVLDLYCGPMAIAGSTRMQATTSEMLIAGAALERAIDRLSEEGNKDFAAKFSNLLDDLERNAAQIAEYTEFEADLYRKNGLVTYCADDFMIDIFTDTTERAPTFMLPPFRRSDDATSPVSWAFVKNPYLSTKDTWRKVYCREPRCLNWTSELYAKIGASERIVNNPPSLTTEDLQLFSIGREDRESRCCRHPNATVAVLASEEVAKLDTETPFGDAFATFAEAFDMKKALLIGANYENAFSIDLDIEESPINLWKHLAVKLVLNTVSTATMALLGRVEDNWMAFVEASNKKLIDRSTRLVSELGGVDYKTACHAVFNAIDQISATNYKDKERPSPVQLALKLVR